MCVKPRNQKETDRAYASQQKSGSFDPASGEMRGRAGSESSRALGAMIGQKVYGEGIRFDQTTAGKVANTPGGATAQGGTMLGSAPKPMVQNTAAVATPRRRTNGGSGSAIPPGQNTLLGG